MKTAPEKEKALISQGFFLCYLEARAGVLNGFAGRQILIIFKYLQKLTARVDHFRKLALNLIQVRHHVERSPARLSKVGTRGREARLNDLKPLRLDKLHCRNHVRI